MDYSPWGCKELDTTEQLHMHAHMRDQMLGYLSEEKYMGR